MEKKESFEHKSSRSPWLPLLGFLTAMFSSGMVAVTLVTYLDLHELDKIDIGLKMEIIALREKLEDIRMEHQLPVNEIGVESEKQRLKRFQPTSFFDVILKAQESVFEKYCHDTNITCPQGKQGDKGIQGEPGLPGQLGASGAVGPKGQLGDQGVVGFRGQDGDIGITGKQGDEGPQGSPGKTGIHGDTGLAGVQGVTGLIGAKGSKGQKGDDGLQGRAGLPGDPGPSGIKGEKGDQGVKGLNGDAGPQGPKGKDVKKLGDGCECLKKPTFRQIPYSLETIGSKRSIAEACVATGNPIPNVTIRKLSGEDEASGKFECLATNYLGTTRKYIQI